jgi:beta-lactamase regulating signal transducer with metallopeptidase domain
VPSTEPQPAAVSAVVAPDLLGALTQPRSLDLNVPQMIVAAYGIVVAGFALWWLVGIAQLVRLCRTATPAPASAVEAFREIAGPAADRVRLLASRRIELPLTFTGLAPVILLPEVVCRDGGAALRFCLAHEWSHVERRDAWRWYLATLVQFVFFYQPLFWWLRRQLRLCQDYLADARAAEQAPEAEDYADYLVALARRAAGVPMAALGIGDRRSNLYRRILMLLTNREPLERRCLTRWNVGATLAGLLLLFAVAAVRLDAGAPVDDKKEPPAKDAPKENPKEEPKKVEALKYTGRVFDKDTDKGIEGVTVTVRRSLLGDPEEKEENRIVEETKHKTDAEGKYTFTIPPEQVAKRYLYIELDVEHPNYAPRKHFGYALSMILKNEKIGGRPFFENVDMRRGEAVTGVVKTPDGKPAAGVKVLAYSVTSNKKEGEFEYGSFADARTDDKGHFRLVLTTPGAAVVWMLPEKYIPTTHVLKDNKRGDLGTFSLQEGINLRGKVLDANGKPVIGVNVNAEALERNEELQGLLVADQISRSAVTNDKGEFEMAPLPPGAYKVHPDEHARDGSRDDRVKRAVPGVFVAQKVTLKGDAKPESIEVRAVPHVTIEAQYYDSKGKKSRGHEFFVFGRMDNLPWFGRGKADADGKITAVVPHGLEQVQLDLMTNEHGVLRHRIKKEAPLSNSRRVDLGTLNDDVKGIELVRYEAPILIVKVVAKDGGKLENAAVTAMYPEGKGQFPGRLIQRNGRQSDVSFEHQEDGRFRSMQLLPDEEVTVSGHADGYASKSEKMTLAEGMKKEIEIILDKAPAEKKDDKKEDKE